MARTTTRSKQKADAKAKPRGHRGPSRQAPPEPESTIELVTPEMARNWLGGRTRNRNVRDTKVLEYAIDMEAGRWHVAAALVFNVDGQLIDGQHRLEAVVLHDEPVLFNVVRNAVPEAMLAVDTGLKRTLADFLRMRNVSSATDIAVLIRAMWRWDYYKTFNAVPSTQKSPTIQQAMAYFEEHEGDLHEAVTFATRYYKRTFIMRSVIGGLHILFNAIDSEDELEFWRLVADGADGAPTIIALRRRLLENHTKRDKMPGWHVAALVIKAWNLWREATEIEVLVFRPGGKAAEHFPMPV